MVPGGAGYWGFVASEGVTLWVDRFSTLIISSAVAPTPDHGIEARTQLKCLDTWTGRSFRPGSLFCVRENPLLERDSAVGIKPPKCWDRVYRRSLLFRGVLALTWSRANFFGGECKSPLNQGLSGLKLGAGAGFEPAAFRL